MAEVQSRVGAHPQELRNHGRPLPRGPAGAPAQRHGRRCAPALETLTARHASSSARQVVLRIKSLLGYGHRLGYLRFNAGAVIKVRSEARTVAQRIVTEVEMGMLGARGRQSP